MRDVLFAVSIMCLLILLLIFLLKKLHQPYLVAYIIAGVILGPHISGIFTAPEDIAHLGELGIILLMFFLGIEINIPDNRFFLKKPFTKKNFETCVDRKEAIGRALKIAQKGQIVLIAGKGHEDYQVFKDRTIAFNEREIVKECLQMFYQMNYNKNLRRFCFSEILTG